MEKNPNEEIDLIFLYNKVRETWTNFLISAYKGLIFLLRNWIILLLVIAAGIGLGYVWQNNTPKERETTLLVQINFKGVNYVYNAIKQLKKKINEGDKGALIELKNEYDDIFKISNIEIEPIPNIKDLITDTEPFNRNVEVFLDQSKYEEDLLLSEMFVQEYKVHRITLTTAESASNGSVTALLKYLNKNDKYENIKEVYLENTTAKIKASKDNIVAIDSILKVYGSKANVPNSSNQIYLNTANNGNIHMLTEQKITLIDDIEELETELVKYQDGIVSVLNKPMLQKKGSLKDRKMLLLPILFVFFYIVTLITVTFLKRLHRLSNQHDDNINTRGN